MQQTLAQYLGKFNGCAPASDNAIAAAEATLGLTLPHDYVKFLRIADGGEGFIGEHAYVIFWGAGQLAEMNQGYHVQEYAPGLLLFGSDGGGEAYGFDTRQTPWIVGQVPFVGMAREEFWKMASSFLEFLGHLYTKC
jgi:hypothetical protein